MPFRPEHSLLRVEVPALHTIDTGSVENLFGMWSLFSKASHAMEDGKRLENLSWRLWNRETFCCAPQTQARSTLSPRCSFAVKPHATAATTDIPELSTSLDSAVSDELDDDETSSAPATSSGFIAKARPALRRHDSSSSSTSRGREKHITPVDLEKIVQSIKETKQLERIELSKPTPNTTTSTIPASRAADPPAASTLQNFTLTRPTPEQQASPPRKKVQNTTQQLPISPSHSPSSRTETLHSSTLESSASTVDTDDAKSSQAQTVGSEDSSNTEMSTHSIVRGFVPGGAPSSYRSQTHLAAQAQPTPILKTSPTYQQAKPKKKGPIFTIGTSSGEEESSLESRYQGSHGSLLAKSLDSQRRPDGSDSSTGSKKQTSFKEEVAVGRAAEHSPVFDSDDEEDEVSESAIDDDDDSSDWEDSDDNQSGPSSVNEKEMFQRVDSRPNLTSRRSLLTSLMHEPDRAKAMQNAASRSSPALRRSRASSPNGPSNATSPEPDVAGRIPGAESRSKPIIMTTSNTHNQQLSLSPRTTRRNMLSTELTESLRKNLLWERQHKSTGNLAALKRRHTAQDMTKLKQQPEPITLSHQDPGLRNHTNEYFNAGLQEYHAKGW